MESHEEKLAKMIRQSKEREAQQEMVRSVPITSTFDAHACHVGAVRDGDVLDEATLCLALPSSGAQGQADIAREPLERRGERRRHGLDARLCRRSAQRRCPGGGDGDSSFCITLEVLVLDHVLFASSARRLFDWL